MSGDRKWQGYGKKSAGFGRKNPLSANVMGAEGLLILLWKISEKCTIQKNYPFILEVMEGAGEICLTDEEHRVLVDYFRLVLRKDNIERRQIYFRGHTDGYAYLKKIGAV